MKAIISRNPFSGQIARELSFNTEQQIMEKIQIAKQGFEVNRRRQTKDKHSLIKQVTKLVERNKQQFAKLVTFQTGKPISQSLFEVSQTVKICDYYSKHRDGVLALNIKSSAKKKTLVKYLPLGTVYCMLPSRYPLLMSFYKSLPQLLMGNGVLMRHAHNNLGVSKEVQKIMKKGGFESGEYQTIWSDYKHSEMIIQNQNITGVSFTGSTSKASVIAGIAGKYIKRAHISGSLKSHLIILQDGNVQNAVQSILKGGHFNGGQGVAPRVFIVHQAHFQKCKEILKSKLEKSKIGNPDFRQTEMGTLNYSQVQQNQLSSYMASLPAEKTLYRRSGIKIPFFSPIIIESNLQLAKKSVQGPIFHLISGDNDQHCIELANKMSDSSISFIFSSKNWQPLSLHLQTGSVILNKITYFDPSVPLGLFGSTHSRQGQNQGVRSLCNLKTIYVN